MEHVTQISIVVYRQINVPRLRLILPHFAHFVHHVVHVLLATFRPTVLSLLTVTSRSKSFSFHSFMPTKDLAPCSYIPPPHKKPSFIMINFCDYSTSCRWRFLSWVQLHQQMGSAVICPTHKPCYTPPQKFPFINPEKPLYGCQQFVHKYYSLVGLGLGLWLGFGSV